MLLGLAGDTMLGRQVAGRLAIDPPTALVSPEVVAIAHEADLLVMNLECCISERGERWPAAGKPFFFRAPPAAVELLTLLGVDSASSSSSSWTSVGLVVSKRCRSRSSSATPAWRHGPRPDG